MAAHSQLFTLLSLSLALFLSLTSFDFSASEPLPSSPTIASDQLNFWSRNVQNRMPDSILNKLSPMSTEDCNYYSKLMMSENDNFSADSNFCSLARLACVSAHGDDVNKVAGMFAHFFRTGDLKHENSDLFAHVLRTGDLKPENRDLFAHFLRTGELKPENRDLFAHFLRTGDLKPEHRDLFAHFLRTGDLKPENRDLFAHFLRTGDLKPEDRDLFAHFLRTGDLKSEDRDLFAQFLRTGDLKPEDRDLFAHFLRTGDVKPENQDLFAHFLRTGDLKPENRDLFAHFLRTGDLKPENRDLFAHFLRTGDLKHENRDPFAHFLRTGDLKHESHDPFSFFRLEKLKTGNLIHLSNLKAYLPERSFLPEKIASRIPLNMEAISQIFPGITTAETVKEIVETFLSYCNTGEMKGEMTSCPKSLEELIGFAKLTLGGEKLIALTAKSTKGSNSELMVRKVKKLNNAKKTVTCHEAFLPFAAYFCHSLSSTQLYEVDLVEPTTEHPVNTVFAICHMDTSQWPKDHMAFEILKIGPGEGEACHWVSQLDLSWISAMPTDEAR